MQMKKLFDSRLVTVLAGAAIVAMVGAGAGYSAGTITSKDIKDKTIKTKDLKPGTVDKLKGQTGPQGPQGPAGPAGTAGTATYAGPHWSIVDRNVEQRGDSYLRSGPGTPPKGIGSLGIRTGDAPTGGLANCANQACVDKAAFGNEVDFLGQTLASLNTLKYSVFATGEDLDINADNAPSLEIEIDPTGPADNTAPNFSTLVFDPTGLNRNVWTALDASTAQRWWLTGNAGTSPPACTQASFCTLAAVKAKFPNASVLTVQITKGRDFEFSGAVDALVINSTTYDFEPFGVTATG